MLIPALLIAAATIPTVGFEPRVELRAGATVIVEAPVRLPTGLPTATARLQVTREGAGVEIFPAADVVVRGRNSLVRWALAAGPRPSSGAVQLVVVIEGPRRIVRRLRVRQRVDVTAAPPPEAAAVRADLAELTAGGAASPDSVPLPARADLQRWATLNRLKLASTRPDRLGQRAYAAVADASPGSAEAPEASVAPAASAEAGLSVAATAMTDFDVGAAQAALAAARSEGRPTRDDLARILELQGCLQSTLDREPRARQLWTQALSLDPDLSPECPIPWGRAHFDDLRDTLAPERALAVGRVALTPGAGRRSLDVTVDVAPDPGRLARAVELELRPDLSGDLESRTAKIEHARDVGRARATLPVEGTLAQQVPVTVRVLDEDGALLAAEGTPDPIYVPLPREERARRVPEWVWWVAGGVALAGGAAAAAIVAAEGAGPSEPERGLGPVDIRF